MFSHIIFHNAHYLEQKHFALIGKSLTHSFSKKYFEKKFADLGLAGYSYELIELPTLDLLRETVMQRALDGFNVTIPYKKDILALLDDLDATATEIGAVNTVKVERNGGKTVMHGYNTDAPAFLNSLQNTIRSAHRHTPSFAWILGTGGASQAVAWALRCLNINYRFVSREPEKHFAAISYEEIRQYMEDVDLIVNSTPVGMFPDVSKSPWPLPDLISSRHICIDLIYNPSPTLFLKQAAERGATTKDGLEMLYLQAELSFKIWE